MLFPCLENPVEEHMCSTSQCELILFVSLLLTKVYCAKVFCLLNLMLYCLFYFDQRVLVSA
jgi:hypothetical protein